MSPGHRGGGYHEAKRKHIRTECAPWVLQEYGGEGRSNPTRRVRLLGGREKSVIAGLYLVCNQGVGECMVMGEVGALGENCGHGWGAGHIGEWAPEVARAPENFLFILPFGAL